MRLAGAIAAGVAAVLVCAGSAQAFDPVREAANVAKGSEREQVWLQPGYQLQLGLEGQRTQTEAALTAARDPERNFLTDACNSKGLACAGDIRLNQWKANGYGLVDRVLWTARNGSTVAGRVWATRAGPRKRPAIVITNGSIQASEELYWWAAQTLAKAGYVVVTFDPQMQGLSDTFGEGADRNEGFPSQTAGNTFYDWTQDAIDFLLSTPAKPFCARPSRSGTSHCPKQARRVKAGLNAAYNPMWKLVEGHRIGIAGHSYGASGVSWMGQQDKRVDAVVAWDNLCDPGRAPGTGTPLEGKGCSAGATGPPPGHRVPSLGLTVDSTGGEPRTSDPDPQGKSGASRAFSRDGVDTGSLVIRGGTHFDFSYIPMQPFRATLRGVELSAWYTRAWFDRYVKQDPAADRQLLSTRWRSDPGDRRVDPAGRGNLFSFYYRSRLDVRTVRRQAGHVRGHALRLLRAGGRRRPAGRLLLPGHRALARPPARPAAAGAGVAERRAHQRPPAAPARQREPGRSRPAGARAPACRRQADQLHRARPARRPADDQAPPARPRRAREDRRGVGAAARRRARSRPAAPRPAWHVAAPRCGPWPRWPTAGSRPAGASRAARAAP